jgi:serine/threonine-protein kinase
MIELTGSLGKYKILKKLGSGGFGTVYLMEDTILKANRAVKIPHRTNLAADTLFQESIVQTRLLDHPNIVKLLTVDVVDGNVLMVMEYVEGIDLESLIDQKAKLDLSESLRFLKQILSALAFAHDQRVIHRDIRPSNIMIDLKNNVKITDFGTSILLKERQYATTRIGSPPYMAPEQFEGKAVFASDIYSAGCLFYEMVTGFPPVVLANPMEIYKRAKEGNFEDLREKEPTVTEALNAVVKKMLHPDLKHRYTSVAELFTDLNQALCHRADHGDELKMIKSRIQARTERVEYICWNCRKVMPRKSGRCLYCGSILE